MSLDYAILPQILAHWAESRGGELVNIGQYHGFSGAVILRVATAGGDFCLRGWPAKAPPVERIRGLHRLLAHVSAAGVTQVSTPVPITTGDTLVSMHGRCWQLEPWKPGAADFHRRPSDERLRNAMAVLAGFHRAAWTFEPKPDEQAYFAVSAGIPPCVLERRGHLRSWQLHKLAAVRGQIGHDSDEFARLGREILDHADRLVSAIAAQLEAAAMQKLALGPCIRDIWHDHVLFTGDAVTGLIDLSACRTDHVAADLARLLGSLCEDHVQWWDLALDAYCRHRSLSVAEIGLVPVLDRSGVLLSGLLWLERRYLRREPIDMHRVWIRLRTIIRRLRQMT